MAEIHSFRRRPTAEQVSAATDGLLDMAFAMRFVSKIASCDGNNGMDNLAVAGMFRILEREADRVLGQLDPN